MSWIYYDSAPLVSCRREPTARMAPARGLMLVLLPPPTSARLRLRAVAVEVEIVSLSGPSRWGLVLALKLSFSSRQRYYELSGL